VATRKPAADGGSQVRQSGWNEWGQHVLAELGRLSSSVDSMSKQVAAMQADSRLQTLQVELDDLKAWRKAHDEAATPNQISKLMDKVEELKAFHYRTLALVGGGQVVLGVILWWFGRGH
jgi:hypothetical protein